MRRDRFFVDIDRSLTAALAPPGSCSFCGGSGSVWERLDREREEVQVPCHSCRVWCAACKAYVKRSGHECKEG